MEILAMDATVTISVVGLSEHSLDLPKSSRLVDERQKLQLHETLDEIDSAVAHICHDGGSAHLAALTRTPIIYISSGATHYGEVWPMTEVLRPIVKYVDCHPCKKVDHCPLGTSDCVQLISADQIISELRQLLSKATCGAKK